MFFLVQTKKKMEERRSILGHILNECHHETHHLKWFGPTSLELTFHVSPQWKKHARDYRMMIACPLDMNTKEFLCEVCRIRQDNALIGYKDNHRVCDMDHLKNEIRSFFQLFIEVHILKWRNMLDEIHEQEKSVKTLQSLSWLTISTSDLQFIHQDLILPII